jgi:hypothetical protein
MITDRFSKLDVPRQPDFRSLFPSIAALITRFGNNRTRAVVAVKAERSLHSKPAFSYV